MRTGTFSYVVEARTSLAHAVRLLSDFSQHELLHPLIDDVQPMLA